MHFPCCHFVCRGRCEKESSFVVALQQAVKDVEPVAAAKKNISKKKVFMRWRRAGYIYLYIHDHIYIYVYLYI